MGGSGSKKADLAQGTKNIHNVIRVMLEVAVSTCEEFRTTANNQRSVSITDSRGKTVSFGFADFFDYLWHLNVLIEEHHYHEEHMMFPVLKEKLPDELAEIEVCFSFCLMGVLVLALMTFQNKLFEKDHTELMEKLQRFEEIIKAKNANEVEKTATELKEILSQLQELLLPHLQREEEKFTHEKLSTVLTPKEQFDIENRIVKHAQKGPGSNVRFAIMFYTLSETDRKVMFAQVPGFVTGYVITHYCISMITTQHSLSH